MSNIEFFKDYHTFLCFQQDRYGKTTLFENEHILVGLNCLQTGQVIDKHAHEVQCRFYLVLEGTGKITIGEVQEEISIGMVIWIPSGKPHRIENNGSVGLTMLVGIAPSKAE